MAVNQLDVCPSSRLIMLKVNAGLT